MLNYHHTGRFKIRLSFPNEELPSQEFMVTTAMTVPVLASALARLMQVSSPLSLFVAPRWERLDHSGFIVARFLPDRVTPCPYLQPWSTLRVIARRVDLEARRVFVQQQFGRINLSPVDGGFSPHELVFGLPASPSPLATSHPLDSRAAPGLGPASTLDNSSSLVLFSPSRLVSLDSRAAPGLGPASTFETSSSLVLFSPSRLVPSSFLVFHSATGLGPVATSQFSSSLDFLSSSRLGHPPPVVSFPCNIRRNGESERELLVESERELVMEVSSDLQDDERSDDGVRSDGLGSPDGDDLEVFDNDLSEEREMPPSKRLRSSESKLIEETIIPVSRRERNLLLKKFRQEQKQERRRYKLLVKQMWEDEIAEEKENFSKAGDLGGSSSSSSVFDPETIAEAYENYLFDKMMHHDGDAAHLLAHFRASLKVVPPSGSQDEALVSSLRRDRTTVLFEGIRRVYFGETEMEKLQQGIDELEGRRVRRRVLEDSGPPLPPVHHDDEDPPPPSIAHTNIPPTARTGVIVSFSSLPESQDPPPYNDTSDLTDSAGVVVGRSILKPIRKLVLLSKRVLRRIMAAKESLFKFGILVPKNDREAFP